MVDAADVSDAVDTTDVSDVPRAAGVMVVQPPAPLRPLAALEAELTELTGHLNAAGRRWLVLLAEFDRREGWADGGFTRSCAHWLAWKCGIDRGAAREKVRVARALEGLPSIGAAMSRGELSYSKVRALTRVATPATEETLLMIALHGTADHVERVVRGWRRVQRAGEPACEARQHAGRSLTYRHDDDGAVLLQVRLTAEAGALVLHALQAAERAGADVSAETSAADEGGPQTEERAAPAQSRASDAANAHAGVSAETRRLSPGAAERTAERTERADTPEPARAAEPADTPAQRRADALVRLAEGWLAAGVRALAGGERQAIVVHVDAAVLGHRAVGATATAAAAEPTPAGRCELEHGPAIATETARRLACDASLVTIVEDGEGRTLDVGRSRRTVPAALGRALRARDDGACRYPGCTHRLGLDAHHIHHWADGGATRLSNLVSLCRRHHRQVHEGGVSIDHGTDGALRFVDERGREILAAPPTVGAFTRLLALNEAHDIRITPDTAVGRWAGERLDLHMAVEGLCFEEARAAHARHPTRALHAT